MGDCGKLACRPLIIQSFNTRKLRIIFGHCISFVVIMDQYIALTDLIVFVCVYKRYYALELNLRFTDLK